jgi:hypothetical protein
MPFFDRRYSTEKFTKEEPKRRSTLFERHHSRTARRSASPYNDSKEDPSRSIMAVRERVLSAEAAEREASKALAASQKAVREAREHVKRLEREAAEEARLAKIKQKHAKSISKRAKTLGRTITPRYNDNKHVSFY